MNVEREKLLEELSELESNKPLFHFMEIEYKFEGINLYECNLELLHEYVKACRDYDDSLNTIEYLHDNGIE
ncbi:hypothetical protein [Psychrobacillus phage Perkons]|nr:hypothetical protein [Psychrobacillus phage Perkons]